MMKKVFKDTYEQSQKNKGIQTPSMKINQKSISNINYKVHKYSFSAISTKSIESRFVRYRAASRRRKTANKTLKINTKLNKTISDQLASGVHH